ncbi:hypothetical protein C1646_666445 [Rhizophagus diaphanus]|nr:hypothetical protein C1646_666445 [Rhizophagus diaphanus] [Rhizophagus sp. MUCL 43196]
MFVKIKIKKKLPNLPKCHVLRDHKNCLKEKLFIKGNSGGCFTEEKKFRVDMEVDNIQKWKEFGKSKGLANMAAKKNKPKTIPVTEDEVVDIRMEEDTDLDSNLEGGKAEGLTKTPLK